MPETTVGLVSQDIEAREPGTRARVLLREEQFDLITRAMGCTSEAGRARLLEVDPKTIYRARHGVLGEEFIAKVLDAMERHQSKLAELGFTAGFGEVFELGEKRPA